MGLIVACPWLPISIVDGSLESRHLSIELFGCLEHLFTLFENLFMIFKKFFSIDRLRVGVFTDHVNDRLPQICYLLILGPWSYLDCRLSVISVNIFVYKRVIVRRSIADR